jgi:hypothetical protein
MDKLDWINKQHIRHYAHGCASATLRDLILGQLRSALASAKLSPDPLLHPSEEYLWNVIQLFQVTALKLSTRILFWNF